MEVQFQWLPSKYIWTQSVLHVKDCQKSEDHMFVMENLR